MRGRRLQVLLEVEKGPATSRDVADATGIPFANVCAVLSQLHSAGFVTRKALPGSGRGKSPSIYHVPEVRS